MCNVTIIRIQILTQKFINQSTEQRDKVILLNFDLRTTTLSLTNIELISITSTSYNHNLIILSYFTQSVSYTDYFNELRLS